MSKLSPEKIRAKRANAKRCMEKGDPGRATDILRELAGQGCMDPEFLCEMAEAHHAAHDFPSTEGCLERLLKMYAGNGVAHSFAGRLLYRMRRPEAALAAYAGIADSDDPDGIARLAKVSILERQGRLEDAREIVSAVLRGNPASPRARYLSAVLAGREGRPDEAIAALHDLLAGDICREIRGEAGHALASLLDKQKDYAGALRTLLETKAAMEAAYPVLVAESRAENVRKSEAIRKLTTQLTADHLRRWRDIPRDTPSAPPCSPATRAAAPRYWKASSIATAAS
jgi:tetratricopeptide (TPR) repeat protein